MVDVLPGQLGHVDEAVHAAEVDEGAEVHDARHHAAADLAGLEVGEEVLALLLLRLLEPGPTGQHDVVAVLVELDDLRLDRLADVGLEVAHPAQLHQGGGEEAPEADVEDQAALDDLDDRAGDDAVLLLDALDVAPGPLVLGPLLGQDQAALLVLLGEDEGLDLVAEADDLVGVDVVADRQLAAGDHALGLVADVEQDLVPSTLTTVPSTSWPSSTATMVPSMASSKECRRGRRRRSGGGGTCRLRRRCRRSETRWLGGFGAALVGAGVVGSE